MFAEALRNGLPFSLGETTRRHHSGKVEPFASGIQLFITLRIDDFGRNLERLEGQRWKPRPTIPDHWNALPHVSSSPALTPSYEKYLHPGAPDVRDRSCTFRLSARLRDEYSSTVVKNGVGAVDLEVCGVSIRQLSDDGLVLLGMNVHPVSPRGSGLFNDDIGPWLFACQAARSSHSRWRWLDSHQSIALHDNAKLETKAFAASLLSRVGIVESDTIPTTIFPAMFVHSNLCVYNYLQESTTTSTDPETGDVLGEETVTGATRELLLSTLSGHQTGRPMESTDVRQNTEELTLRLSRRATLTLSGSNTHIIRWESTETAPAVDIPDDQVLSPGMLLDVWSLHIAQYAFLCDLSKQIGELASNGLTFEGHVQGLSQFIAKSYFGRISTDRRVQDFYSALRTGSGVEEIFHEVHRELSWLAELREATFQKGLEKFVTILGAAGCLIGIGQVIGLEKIKPLGLGWAGASGVAALALLLFLNRDRKKPTKRPSR